MVTCLDSWASRFITVLLNTELRQCHDTISCCWPTLLDETTEAIIKQCRAADNSHGQEQDMMMTCKPPVQSCMALSVRQSCTPVSLAACPKAARLGSSGHAAAAAQHPLSFLPSCCTVFPADGLCWPTEHSLI